ncbi:major facilitator superfamily domain-containing protein [Gaertneriomyces semiglobifer]|nr:major facilitator superfamily domain-containing protein [Gaertneriomyces semiglobifer]
MRIMPLIFLSYLLSIIDRSNVSYAKISNAEIRHDMLSTTNMSNEQFSIALATFFVGYIVFEIPSNIVMKKVAASTWIARIMITWGIITCLQVLTKQGWHFILLRFLLGAAEAGFFPGVVYYLTFWYRKQEAARRIAGFYVATTVAGVIGSGWAYGTQMIDGNRGYYGWQWLFITSGVPTIALGIVILFVLPNSPETAKSSWLSEEERTLACERLRQDNIAKNEKKVDKAELRGAFLDVKNWMFVLCYMGVVMCSNALGLFLPTVLFILGWKSLDATRMSVGPYAAGAVATLAAAWYSDKYRQRSYPIVVTSMIGVIGFVVLAATDFADKAGKYTGAILAVAGSFSTIPLIFTWLSNNMRSSTEAAVTIALVSSVGNIGSVIASYAEYKDDGPKFIPSHIANAAGLVLTAIMAMALRFIYIRQNKQQARLSTDTERAANAPKVVPYML